MFKRIFLAVLTAASLLAFSACDDNSKEVNNNTGNVQNNQQTPGDVQDGEEEQIDYLSDLSTEKYDGYNFRMLLRKGMIADQYLEEDSTDLVESATYKRNKYVEERYGITITATESSSTYETDALNSILAGDDAYDLIFAHSRAAFTYAVQGAAYNVNDIESIHLDKPWWSNDIKNSCNVNGYLYVLDGDITTQGLGNAMSMFFNKNLFDELGFDYPYELVKDGEWTFDEFAYLAKKGGKDLDGDGVITPENDRFGFVTPEWEAPINILYTGGQKIYDKNEEGKLELTLYSNKTVDIFADFFNLLENEACFLQETEGPNKYNGTNPFTDGRAMIYTSTLSSAKGYRNMEDDFGIIPYPKFDEEDEYATVINGHAHLIIIPITVSDVERTGAITEALCAYGSRDVIPAFYDVSLKTKYARDEESEDMMDLIKSSIVYDLGYVSGSPLQSVGRDLAKATSHDFASFYASKESSALIQVEEFNEDYGHFES